MPLRRAASAPASRGESTSVNTEHAGPDPIVGRASSRGQVRLLSLSLVLTEYHGGVIALGRSSSGHEEISDESERETERERESLRGRSPAAYERSVRSRGAWPVVRLRPRRSGALPPVRGVWFARQPNAVLGTGSVAGRVFGAARADAHATSPCSVACVAAGGARARSVSRDPDGAAFRGPRSAVVQPESPLPVDGP